MCVATVSLAVAAIGAAVGAYGQHQQGQAQKRQAAYQSQIAQNNQTIANQNAEAAIRAGTQRAEMESMRGRAALGKIKAQQAASGIVTSEGSALDVQQGAREANVLDTQSVLHRAQLEAYGYRSQASNFAAQSDLYNMQGDAASAAGTTGALSTLLSGASGVADKWAKLPSGTTKLPADPWAEYGGRY